MKGSYVSVERLVRNDIEEGELAILLEKGHIACLEPSPDVSPSLLRQTVTPRTLAKANAQWRQITKKENYGEAHLKWALKRSREQCGKLGAKYPHECYLS
ncbi:hypothetical protein, conserved [Eimeria tenella]|uniref:Uncharacterized protein n=1 Tax=Eimeria tenella TaxID=5802 RepID=U6KRN6_EIMTE|nr:hypothetical protein, conserved [Eimeria tenella]CDJ39009.1 hypothetical protein, conserved [Eimeria tenella]|eukprot:XP_013229764.1 hypothetical protein, conserved [Eimeria tenella]